MPTKNTLAKLEKFLKYNKRKEKWKMQTENAQNYVADLQQRKTKTPSRKTGRSACFER